MCNIRRLSIDLYKPLSRGRMLKFEGKSSVIGFKYERLPKFCYHCGAICHGVEGCLKRTMMWNQEINQFGPWLRATSPTCRMEWTQERHANNMDSSRNTQPGSEGWPKHDPWRGERGTRQSRRERESGEEDDDSNALWENYQLKTKKWKDGEAGKDQGTVNGNIPADSQCYTEGGFVGGLKNIFEKQSTIFNAQVPQATYGKSIMVG